MYKVDSPKAIPLENTSRGSDLHGAAAAGGARVLLEESRETFATPSFTGDCLGGVLILIYPTLSPGVFVFCWGLY